MSGVSKSPNKDKAGEGGIRCRRLGLFSKAGVRAGEVTAETTFEWRDLRLRRPVVAGAEWTQERGQGMWAEGAGKVLRGLVGHREDFTLHETRTLLGF